MSVNDNCHVTTFHTQNPYLLMSELTKFHSAEVQSPTMQPIQYFHEIGNAILMYKHENN